MPRGGPRFPTGRPVGSKNKSTIEREARAAAEAKRDLEDHAAGRRQLPKDVLEQFMITLAGMAAVYQPLPPGTPIPPGREPNEAKFERYARLALDAAKFAAPYFHPTFKAIQVSLPPDHAGAPKPGDNAKAIDGKVIDLRDPAQMAKAYQRMIASAGKK